MQDANDLRRKPTKLKLFSIVVSPALAGKQAVNGQIPGNRPKLLTIPQSSPKTIMVSRNLIVQLTTRSNSSRFSMTMEYQYERIEYPAGRR
jgi:hypothetical protein